MKNKIQVKQENKSVQTQNTAIIQSSWHGPLPRPEQLAQFDQVIPGAAERILKMAEKEQEHRQITEKIISDAQSFALKKESSIDAFVRPSGTIFLFLTFFSSVYFAKEGQFDFALLFFCPSVISWLIRLIAGWNAKK